MLNMPLAIEFPCGYLAICINCDRFALTSIRWAALFLESVDLKGFVVSAARPLMSSSPDFYRDTRFEPGVLIPSGTNKKNGNPKISAPM